MKLILPVLDPAEPVEVDGRFGRAAGFVLVDTGSGRRKGLRNPAATEPSGAGVKAARTVLDAGAEAVAVEHVGPKAEEVLRAGRVVIYNLPPGRLTVDEALELLAAGELSEQ